MTVRTSGRTWTVGQVARLSGVTVRTLHHYDETGLLPASERSDAGYRLYTTRDIERLQQILLYRELDLPLEEIAQLLDEDADVATHLRRHHHLITQRIARLEELAATIELHLEARQMGIELTPEEMVEVFGDEHASKQAEYAAEAEERWGDTDAWAESQRRTKGYSKDQWKEAMAAGEAAARQILAAKEAGLPPDSVEAMAGAEAHRLHIDRWFYACSHDMQRNLADMYVADARFTKTYEDIGGEGFAQYVRDAIHANADVRSS